MPEYISAWSFFGAFILAAVIVSMITTGIVKLLRFLLNL